jgi:hypothetical protein
MKTIRKMRRRVEAEDSPVNDRKRQIRVRGNYQVVTNWMRKKQVYTKQDVIGFYMEELGKDYKAACGSAIIMLSPRLESKNGDCRGSASNPWGHLAYNEKLTRRIDSDTNKKEKQRYRFKFREVSLDKKRHTYYRRKTDQEKESTAKKIAPALTVHVGGVA